MRGVFEDLRGAWGKAGGGACGGFTGKRCEDARQVCIDNPRDDYAPPTGADCRGVCVILDGSKGGGAGGY